MTNRVIRILKDLMNISYRSVVQDEINLKQSFEIENLIKKMRDLELYVNENINETRKSIYECELRTPNVICIDKKFESILKQIRELIRPQKYPISKLEFFGNEFDGGYFIFSTPGKKINLISIGIGENYSFDIEIAKRGGVVEMYDGTIKDIQNLPVNVTLIRKNVGNKVENNEIKLSSVVDKFKENSQLLDDVNVIKIDIEGAEWKLFSQFDFKSLDNFNSLVVEFHDIGEKIKSDDMQNLMIDVLTDINNYFVPVYFSPNNWAGVIKSGHHAFPDVFEVTYINKAQYVDQQIPAHEAAHNKSKPSNNPFRPGMGRFFI